MGARARTRGRGAAAWLAAPLLAAALAMAGCSTPPRPERAPDASSPAPSAITSPVLESRAAPAPAAPPSAPGPSAPLSSAPPSSAPLSSAPPSSVPPSNGVTAAATARTAARTTAASTDRPDASSASVTGRLAPPPFAASVARIDAALARRMRPSHHPGCPVPLSGLRYLRLTYWGFDGHAHTGEMVVAASVAADVVTVFRTLYRQRFPIHRMRLVDDYGASDDASMAADNTSAYNCRPVTGGGGWSAHSYGTAVDINPVENPELTRSAVLPPAGAAFVSRPDEPGVIHPGDVVVRAFARIGWTWGGTWRRPVDLQHFSASGR